MTGNKKRKSYKMLLFLGYSYLGKNIYLKPKINKYKNQIIELKEYKNLIIFESTLSQISNLNFLKEYFYDKVKIEEFQHKLKKFIDLF